MKQSVKLPKVDPNRKWHEVQNKTGSIGIDCDHDNKKEQKLQKKQTEKVYLTNERFKSESDSVMNSDVLASE